MFLSHNVFLITSLGVALLHATKAAILQNPSSMIDPINWKPVSSSSPHTIQYKSIMGDPGMQWKPSSSSSPRMQLFLYNLCSKAGDATQSVIPSSIDTCITSTNVSWGIGQIERVDKPTNGGCCQACLDKPWCLAFSEMPNNRCSLKDNVRPLVPTQDIVHSGKRRYKPNQIVPSPRYANCIVDNTQTITANDNAAQITIGGDVDVEWYAVKKEHDLADKCAVHNQATGRTSYFWTTMSQNGNAPAALGKNPNNCLPQCYYDGDAVHPGGYPSAVNASKDRCPMAHASSATHGFNNLPMNQAKVLVGLTDPSDPELIGRFNWTFELQADLSVPEQEFPKNQSLGIWEWRYDTVLKKGIVRV
jgi:hypothetical protein